MNMMIIMMMMMMMMIKLKITGIVEQLLDFLKGNCFVEFASYCCTIVLKDPAYVS